MLLTYEIESQKTASEKVILAHMEPTHRLVLWTLDAGAIYTRAVDHYVIDVAVAGISLIKANSAALNSGEFYFDYLTKTIYVRLGDDSNPQSAFMVATYRKFYSNSGHKLSWDLTDAGDQVDYEPYIDTTSRFIQELDTAELLGISVESQGQISFNNNDGHFDPIFDRLIWEFKRVAIYSWFPGTVFSESRLMFEGVIENKGFTESKVKFNIKDFIYKLRQPVSLDLFTDADGVLSEDVVGVKYKRRIYGKVNGLRMQSLDQTLKGFPLTGTISGSLGATTINGSGTEFFKQLSPDDEIIVVDGFDEFTYKVETIISDTNVTITDEIENTFVLNSAINKPNRPYRRKNKLFHVAGHKLREPTVVITAVFQKNRFEMDVTDFFVDDIIKVGIETARIKRISNNLVILYQDLDNIPLVGTTITRAPVDAVYFNKRALAVDRDYTINNTATECTISIDDMAEVNITPRQLMIGSLTFSNASKTVTGTNTNFPDDVRPRDFIQSSDLSHTTFYEVREVIDETNLLLRIDYAGTNSTGIGYKKNVEYIDDDSAVTTDCIGKENSDGDWIKTASDAVLDMIKVDAEIANIDTESFENADIEADYILSLKLPLEPEGAPPLIREAVTLINQSVFGSLIAKQDFTIAYNVLTPDRPNDLTEITDHDLTGTNSSFSVETNSDIRRKITVKYNHFDADQFTGEPGNKSTNYENEMVDYLVGTKDEKTIDCYLLESEPAECMAQRYALIHSLSHSVVTIKSKLNLTLKNLNDKIYVGLDRLFDRFGGSASAKKIGIISKISRGAKNTTISFSDLSNQFNRVGAIASDTSEEFTLASDDEKIKNGYIVSNDTELPDDSSDDQWNTNLIG